jgi:hypothetical protein
VQVQQRGSVGVGMRQPPQRDLLAARQRHELARITRPEVGLGRGHVLGQRGGGAQRDAAFLHIEPGAAVKTWQQAYSEYGAECKGGESALRH